MSDVEPFFDTNVLLYLLSSEAKADRVEELLDRPGVISVQVLNEFTAVATRKLAMPYAEIREILGAIRGICRTVPLTVETHDRATEIAERYGFSFYDSSIIASALLAGCEVLHSEDMQHGQLIDDQLTVINPFDATG